MRNGKKIIAENDFAECFPIYKKVYRSCVFLLTSKQLPHNEPFFLPYSSLIFQIFIPLVFRTNYNNNCSWFFGDGRVNEIPIVIVSFSIISPPQKTRRLLVSCHVMIFLLLNGFSELPASFRSRHNIPQFN